MCMLPGSSVLQVYIASGKARAQPEVASSCLRYRLVPAEHAAAHCGQEQGGVPETLKQFAELLHDLKGCIG